MKISIRAAVCAAIAICGITADARAQKYPAKPLRIIIGFPAGGPVDIVGRVIAAKLSEVVGQQVIIDNRVGANAMIGTDLVAKAAPDGYTMLLGSPGSLTISPALYPKIPYDTLRDLAPVTQVSVTPEVLILHPSVAARSVPELVALAKARPGQLNFASSGNGGLPHLAQELFKSHAGIDIVHVPFNGGAPAVTAVIGGQVQGMFADLPVVLPHVQGGRVIAIAVTSRKRASLLPNVTTLIEAGYADIEAVNWYGVVVPAKTPRALIEQIHAAFAKVLADPATRERMLGHGAEPVGTTPAQFGDYLRADLARWAKLTKTVNIKVD